LHATATRKRTATTSPPELAEMYQISMHNHHNQKIKILKSTPPALAHCLHPLAIHLELDGIWSWIWSWSRLYSPLGASHLAFAGDVAVVSVVAAAAALVVGNIRYEIKNTSLPTSKGRRGYSHSFQKSRCTVENAVLNINWALRQGYTFDI